jgi:hypothetical protein
LHVLSTPPAFVLSQDQTLRKILKSSIFSSSLTLDVSDLSLPNKATSPHLPPNRFPG